MGIDSYENPEPTVVNCGGDVVLTLGTSISQHLGPRELATVETVVAHVASDRGFTFDALVEQVIEPLRALVAITLHRPVQYYNCKLQPQRGLEPDLHTYPIRVDPDVVDSKVDSRRGYHPLFTARDVDVTLMVPAWLRLAELSRLVIAVAEPRVESGSLQSRVVEVVNAAETLHRALHEEPKEHPFAEKVWDELKATGLNRKERESVRSSVRLGELSLEKRLLQLAEGLGDDFCSWFLQGHVAQWAKVTAAVRNALSHGYPTSHRIERDVGALVGILRLSYAIIRLRLLVEAGLPRDLALMKMIIDRDPEYMGLMRQNVADWGKLAADIRG